MVIASIMIIIGVVTLIWGLSMIIIGARADRIMRRQFICPHGYTNSDNCPVCGH